MKGLDVQPLPDAPVGKEVGPARGWPGPVQQAACVTCEAVTRGQGSEGGRDGAQPGLAWFPYTPSGKARLREFGAVLPLPSNTGRRAGAQRESMLLVDIWFVFGSSLLTAVYKEVSPSLTVQTH